MFSTLEEAFQAVKKNAEDYKNVVAPFNADKALAITAVAQNGRLLKHCASTLQADLEVVYQACLNAPIAIMFADFYIKEKVIGNDGDLLQKLKILMDYKEVKEALEQPKTEEIPTPEVVPNIVETNPVEEDKAQEPIPTEEVATTVEPLVDMGQGDIFADDVDQSQGQEEAEEPTQKEEVQPKAKNKPKAKGKVEKAAQEQKPQQPKAKAKAKGKVEKTEEKTDSE